MNRFFLLFTIAVGIIATPAFAQHQHANPSTVIKRIDEPKPPKRLDDTVVNPIAVLSPLSRYQRFSLDEPLTDWLVANKTVRDIGGWRAYAKESASESAKESAKESARANVNAKPSAHDAHAVAAPNSGVKP